jgi:hypothetical protein
MDPTSRPIPTMTEAVTRGSAAGVAATVAMSAVMLAAQKLGLEGEQPPEAIVEAALDAADVDRSERTENALATLAHLGFGASCGAVYALLRRWLRTPGPPVGHGVGFGLGVYAASYQGWIPALGILPPPRRDRSDRQVSMALAHVVYGAVLGRLAEDRKE